MVSRRRPPRGAEGGRPAHQAPGELKGRLSLARALSKFGVCSRKEAARRIEAGRVKVGGVVVRWPARRIDPKADQVTVDGERVGDLSGRVVLALHKPKGYLTTRTDPQGRKTVYDLITAFADWVFPVGRLDRDTSGLLILTNDHRLGQRLTDPIAHVVKTYHAKVQGIPDGEALQALREGLSLPDGTLTLPATVTVLGGAKEAATWLEIGLTEGKNRQVRRMCAAVGHEVLALTRTAVGGLSLGDLAEGEWRRLAPGEIQRLSGPPSARR